MLKILSVPKPPKVDPKDIPDEIIIKKGETIALDIPYVGELSCLVISNRINQHKHVQ